MPANIAILGAGPCGLMAAEELAKAGHGVTLYDQMPSPARKLLMAGRGGLNLTHSEPLETFLRRYGKAEPFLAGAIHAFPPEALRAWCEGLGQETFVGSSGRVFPRAMKASGLLRAWLRRLEGLGVRFALRHYFEQWHDGALRLRNDGGQALSLHPDATLLALGGASWPRLGSDGAWAEALRQEGIALTPFQPANCGFTVNWSEHLRTRFAGTPLKPVALTHAGLTRQGEVILTAQGLEGGAIYALSAFLRDTLCTQGTATLYLDTRPAMSAEALARKLNAPRGRQSFSSYLRKAGFHPVIAALLHEVVPAAELARATPAALAAMLKALPVTLTGTTGLARAISSSGGIALHQLNAHFMLRDHPGLFAAGEMLDWEAPTGGYLLQACFATGLAAARGILDYLGTR